MAQSNDPAKEKEKQGKKAETEENYGFIKEERVPLGRWQKRRKIFRNFLVVIGVAVLFGVIARCSYGISDYVIRHFFNNNEKEQVNLRPTPTVGVEPGGDTVPVLDETAFKSFESIMKGVRTASEALDPCLVRVAYVKEITDPVFKDVTESVTEVSGVIVADNGTDYIIYTPYSTKEAVQYDRIKVTFYGGRREIAQEYSSMASADILLLTVEHKDFRSYELDAIRVAKLGKSSELALGSVLIAVGFPNGRDSSVDMGFLTSRTHKAYIPDTALEIIETNIFGNRGESGILINAKGELVGFISNRFRENSVCIEAVAIDKVEPLLRFLVNKASYPKFGARFRDIDDEILAQMGMQNGIMIEEVEENSIASEQHFRQGDVLTAVGGVPVTSVEEFFTLYTSYGRNDDVEVTFYRSGKKMSASWKVRY